MTFYLKKKVFSHGNDYEIADEQNSVIYTAKGDVFSREARFHLYNTSGRELVNIVEQRGANARTYEIDVNGSIHGTLKKESTWKNTTIEVDSNQGKFEVSKAFSGDDYEISFNHSQIGTVKKDTTSFYGSYVLTLHREDYVEFFVAMLLAIDNLLEHEK